MIIVIVTLLSCVFGSIWHLKSNLEERSTGLESYISGGLMVLQFIITTGVPCMYISHTYIDDIKHETIRLILYISVIIASFIFSLFVFSIELYLSQFLVKGKDFEKLSYYDLLISKKGFTKKNN